jgi:hypothetical protein
MSELLDLLCAVHDGAINPDSYPDGVPAGDAARVRMTSVLAEVVAAMRRANKAHYTGDDTEVEEFLLWFAARHGLADG